MPITVPALEAQPVREFAPGSQVFVHFPADVVAAALMHLTDVRMWVSVKPKRSKTAYTVGAIITADIVWALHNRFTTVLDVSENSPYIGGEILGLVPVYTGPGEITYVTQDSVLPVVDGVPVFPDAVEESARQPIDIPLEVCYDPSVAATTGNIPVPEREVVIGAEPIELEEADEADDEDVDDVDEVEDVAGVQDELIRPLAPEAVGRDWATRARAAMVDIPATATTVTAAPVGGITMTGVTTATAATTAGPF